MRGKNPEERQEIVFHSVCRGVREAGVKESQRGFSLLRMIGMPHQIWSEIVSTPARLIVAPTAGAPPSSLFQLLKLSPWR